MSHTRVFHLFVYGSLRSGFRSPAYDYISKYFQLVDEARIRGLLFDMGNFPAAIPTHENRFITGELYESKNPAEFTWAIGQLDDYEGVAAEADEMPLYRRELTEVYLKQGMIQAWVYWYNGDVSGSRLIESGDLLEHWNKNKTRTNETL